MPRTAINVYSVRELDESTLEIIDRVADAGYDGIQFSGPFGPHADDPAAIAERLEARDLDVTPPHIGMGQLQEEFATVQQQYAPLDVDAAVIPSIGSDRFASAAAVDEIAADVEALAEDLASAGWDLHYHNHAHEYVDLGTEWAFERFIDATSIGIELDVGWALVGGDDPAARMRDLGDRAALIHLKDMSTDGEREFREIGAGDVDMAACVEAAEAVGADWLIYEHDQPADPAGTIEHGAQYLAGI